MMNSKSKCQSSNTKQGPESKQQNMMTTACSTLGIRVLDFGI